MQSQQSDKGCKEQQLYCHMETLKTQFKVIEALHHASRNIFFTVENNRFFHFVYFNF